MDYFMRIMNGDESTQLITELYKEGYQKSIIIGHSTDDDKVTMNAFKKAGAQYFEPKPPNPDNIKKIFIDYLNDFKNIKKKIGSD